MQHGFLGYDTTFMLDFVVCALVAIVPVLIYSLFLVKVRRNYVAHRNLQTLLGIVLLVAVLLFELDVQWMHDGWENIVNKPGQPPRLVGEQFDAVRRVLWIHLVFAISTPFLWGATLWLGWRRFANPGARSAQLAAQEARLARHARPRGHLRHGAVVLLRRLRRLRFCGWLECTAAGSETGVPSVLTRGPEADAARLAGFSMNFGSPNVRTTTSSHSVSPDCWSPRAS
ncbi:MAG: hypothetical protein R3B90_02035 [Planctomycetaceae bacterium]